MVSIEFYFRQFLRCGGIYFVYIVLCVGSVCTITRAVQVVKLNHGGYGRFSIIIHAVTFIQEGDGGAYGVLVALACLLAVAEFAA